MSYYIIETDYLGPNISENIDDHTIEIHTKAGVTNSTHERRIEGSLGVTNDWYRAAHGKYETLDAAREAVMRMFGPVRDRHPHGGTPFVCDDGWDTGDDDTVVEVFRPGKYAPVSREEATEWCAEGFYDELTADTTDAQIEALVDQYEEDLHGDELTMAPWRSEMIDLGRRLGADLRDESSDL